MLWGVCRQARRSSDGSSKRWGKGYLSKLVTKAGQTLADTSQLHVRAGEFVADEVEAVMDDDAIVENACAEKGTRMNEFDFTNPDDIGPSEYRAIYECVAAGLEDCPAEERRDLSETMLGEFIEHANAMLNTLREQTVDSHDPTEQQPPPALAADGVPVTAAQRIVAAIRQYLFMKDGHWQWRELSGADFIEFVTLLLSQHDLIPEECEG